MKRAAFWLGLAALIAASRLLHTHLLWADEDYHLAAAIQVLHDKIPYLDFWYDKPPLNLAFYLLFGARTGVMLRLADTAFVVLCCALAFRLAERMWSQREGFVAAGAIGFFSIFYLPPGVIPLEPDTLMLAPHLAAIYWAWTRRPFLAGLAAGIAFQLSPKGALVLISAALFAPGGIPMLLLGFAAPTAIVLAALAAAGALPGYFEQVWKYGLLYAGSSAAEARGAVLSVADWLGFHAALLLGAICYWLRGRDAARWRTLTWCLVALAYAAIGWRFAPRYFMALLPALAIPAARGMVEARPIVRALAFALLLIPAIRFGPRYLNLENWQDTTMDRESRSAAAIIQAKAKPGDTIFIWGYRPDIVAYTRLPVAGRIWDSQPATGVPADRHLSDSRPVSPEWAQEIRAELAQSKPAFLVDGLSRYNAALDIHAYPDLAEWLAHYCEAGTTGGIVIYSRCK